MAVSCVTLLILVVVAEVALRLRGYDPMGKLVSMRELIVRPSANPRLHYELTPNAAGYAWSADVRINSHGFRDREYQLHSEAYRIVALGDSVAFGNRLPVEDRFTDQLEASLNQRSPGAFEVLNLGVGGYDVLQEVASLEHLGLRFSPDLVVVSYSMNDVIDTSPNRAYIEALRRTPSPIFWFRTAQAIKSSLDKLDQARSFLAGNDDRVFEEQHPEYVARRAADTELIRLTGELRARIAASGTTPADSRGGAWDSVRMWLGANRSADMDTVLLRRYTSKARIGKVDQAFSRLAQLGDEHDFGVVVVVNPYLVHNTDFELVYQIVEHLARQHGFDVLQVHREFASAGIERLQIHPLDKGHSNRIGHGLISDKLRDYLHQIGAPDAVQRLN